MPVEYTDRMSKTSNQSKTSKLPSRSNSRIVAGGQRQRSLIRVTRRCRPNSAYFFVIAVAILLPSCRKTQEEPEIEDVIRGYAQLEGLANSHSKELADEWARIRADKATIVDLEQAHHPNAPAEDLNGLLAKVLPDSNRVHEIRRALMRFDPSEISYDDPIHLSQAVATAQRYDNYRQQLNTLVSQPQTKAWYDYASGLTADTSFVQRLEIGFWLEATQVARALNESKIPDAVDSIGILLAYSRKLGDVWAVVPRLRAAELRRQIGFALHAITNHEHCDQESIQRLRNLLIAELANWQQEQNCWIGDRAVGMHTYELVRDGQYLSLLTEEENDRLKENKVQYATARRVSENVDNDQLYYLETMRKLCNAGDTPYFERAEMIVEIELELQRQNDSEHYPKVAVEMLLPYTLASQKQIAIDRARIEAWAHLFSVAVEERAPSSTTNPVNGLVYEVVQSGNSCFVRDFTLLEGEAEPRLVKRW